MVEIIDVKFQGEPEIIACYVLRGPGGVALIETGPGSTAGNLANGLEHLGIGLAQVTDILVTHIHLDHAGAAGWLAQETGATVHVHQVGAAHLADPRRLLASAARIYGDQMGPLWGETLPVPRDQVHALRDGDVVQAAGLSIRAVDTPGHAYHHMAYVLDGLCFSGDVAAVRLPGLQHVRVPTPPPEIDLPIWRWSLAKLRKLRLDGLLPTHFGKVAVDPSDHLQAVEDALEAAAAFVQQQRLEGRPAEEIIVAYRSWIARQAAAQGVGEDGIKRLEIIVPSDMCVSGLLRYWGNA